MLEPCACRSRGGRLTPSPPRLWGEDSCLRCTHQTQGGCGERTTASDAHIRPRVAVGRGQLPQIRPRVAVGRGQLPQMHTSDPGWLWGEDSCLRCTHQTQGGCGERTTASDAHIRDSEARRQGFSPGTPFSSPPSSLNGSANKIKLK